MNDTRKKLPILPIALALCLLAVVLVFRGMLGSSEEAERAEAVKEGIAFLEAQEAKDPDSVRQVRKEIYQRKLAAQRDQLLKQLTDGTIDPFSLFQDYVVMGDSRAVGFWYRDFLDKGRVLADGGHTIRNVADQLDTLASLNPATIYMCYGLNDTSIGYWDTAESYVAEYVQVVKQIKERLPNTKIVVSSILPAKDPAFKQSKKWYNIPEWSAALEKACKENNILFANCDHLADDYPNLWDPDGIHFREDLYPYWAADLVIPTLMEGA